MPELPEVETTTEKLKAEIVGEKIVDIWTDWPKYFKKGSKDSDYLAKSTEEFKECVVGKKIKGVERIGKNIIIRLSGDKALLIHQKLSGHLLLGRWRKVPTKSHHAAGEGSIPESVSGKWAKEAHVPNAPADSPLWDEKNRFVRLLFFFKSGRQMAFSDLRRFGKVVCGSSGDIMNMPDIAGLGPEPLSKDFSVDDFKKLFEGRTARIKSLILDQKFITGVGNIYSDEALWMAKIHPLTPADRLTDDELETLYRAIEKVLRKAVKLKGTSIDDYREPSGSKGGFARELNVYQKDGEPCPRCGTEIERIKMGARSARFCPACQRQAQKS